MTKYIVYNYGAADVADSYVALTVIGRKVVKITKNDGELPAMEETTMTVAEFEALPLPAEW